MHPRAKLVQLALYAALVLLASEGLAAQSAGIDTPVSAAGPEPSRADPVVAFLAGLAIPGLGQVYAGRPVTGGVIFAASAGAVATGFLSRRTRIMCAGPVVDNVCGADDIYARDVEHFRTRPAVIAAALITVGGAIHAFVSARRGRMSVAAADGVQERPVRAIGLPGVEWDGESVRFGILRLVF